VGLYLSVPELARNPLFITHSQHLETSLIASALVPVADSGRRALVLQLATVRLDSCRTVAA